MTIPLRSFLDHYYRSFPLIVLDRNRALDCTDQAKTISRNATIMTAANLYVHKLYTVQLLNFILFYKI